MSAHENFFLFDTVRIWEFSPVLTDFINLSKRNVKLIVKIFSDLEPLGGSSNKKTLYSTCSCVIWAFCGTREPLKPKLHTNSLNKLLFYILLIFFWSNIFFYIFLTSNLTLRSWDNHQLKLKSEWKCFCAVKTLRKNDRCCNTNSFCCFSFEYSLSMDEQTNEREWIIFNFNSVWKNLRKKW
jgi:hypothetical protein